MQQRYNSFGSFVKRTFGTAVHKVNIDAGFTCPNRDGTLGVGGCIYCNNESFTPGSCRPTLSVRQQVANGIGYLRQRYGVEKFLAYFQPYTNTYAPTEVLRRVFMEALEEPAVIGLAIGTRPDCIDEEKLDLLAGISRTHFVLVEYGLQSVYEKTLRFINRGHGTEAFHKAVDMSRARGIQTGAHVIVGFPTESREEMLNMAPEVSDTGVEFIKIHQLQVIKGTPLARIYAKHPFHTFGYREYVDFIVEFMSRLSPGIVMQRLFATAPEEMLVAPKWGRSRHEILRDIEGKFLEEDTRQGKLAITYTGRN
jgi:radical SAM protein (TIGR01212 family)